MTTRATRSTGHMTDRNDSPLLDEQSAGEWQDARHSICRAPRRWMSTAPSSGTDAGARGKARMSPGGVTAPATSGRPSAGLGGSRGGADAVVPAGVPTSVSTTRDQSAVERDTIAAVRATTTAQRHARAAAWANPTAECDTDDRSDADCEQVIPEGALREVRLDDLTGSGRRNTGRRDQSLEMIRPPVRRAVRPVDRDIAHGAGRGSVATKERGGAGRGHAG